MTPEVDWSFLERISLWQIALVVVALYIVGKLLVKFWPWLKKVIALTDSLGQLPVFITETKETLAEQSASIKEHGAALAEIRHEVLPNTGGSMRDAVDKQGLAIAEINKKLAADNKRIGDLEDTRPNPRRSPQKPKEN